MKTIISKTLTLEDFEDKELKDEIASYCESEKSKHLYVVTRLTKPFGKLGGFTQTTFYLETNEGFLSEHLDLKIVIQKYNEL